jgi:nucleotide-binding universal stress UspA family protein
MRIVVWLVEDTWEATVAAAAALAPDSADVELLYVIATDTEQVVHGARVGLLGRRPPAPPPERRLEAISEEGAVALLTEARRRVRRAASTELRRGRVEREVVAAAAGADLLVMARDGDRSRLGPKSIGRHARFVIDHAPCQVLLVWPDEPPPVSTIPPPKPLAD